MAPSFHLGEKVGPSTKRQETVFFSTWTRPFPRRVFPHSWLWSLGWELRHPQISATLSKQGPRSPGSERALGGAGMSGSATELVSRSCVAPLPTQAFLISAHSHGDVAPRPSGVDTTWSTDRTNTPPCSPLKPRHQSQRARKVWTTGPGTRGAGGGRSHHPLQVNKHKSRGCKQRSAAN